MALTMTAVSIPVSAAPAETADTGSVQEEKVQEKSYQITLDAAGGTIQKTVFHTEAGDHIQEPETPKRDGYVFRGWSFQNNSGQTEFWDFDTDQMPERDIKLTAVWEKECTLDQAQVTVAVSAQAKVGVRNAASPQVSWRSGDTRVATVDSSGNIKGKTAGRTYVQAMVGSQVVTADVQVTNPYLAQSSGTVAKKRTSKIPIRGLSADSKVSVSVNKSRANAYIQNGQLVIYPKKQGITKFYITADGKKKTYQAAVTSYQAVKAIAKAKKAKGCRYSQARRMRKGYYDCSSLIWRCYKPYGVHFGSRSYAPVAASEAKYMKRHKKVVSYKRLKASKLLPGDVIFYSYTRNGRYRNISHVALYIGNGRIIHAANSRVGVIEANYKYTKCIKMIARPVK
ncbi:MAG: C40 family peptidase [Anaerostipes sp.]|nr:C40 family peptidase [Anaerostipes sp.]